MGDYVLAIGDHAPYGFSASTEEAATRHAAEYLIERHWAAYEGKPGTAITLAGPTGLLSRPDEGLRAFCQRINPPLAASSMDDIQPGDPMTPDCNTG